MTKTQRATCIRVVVIIAGLMLLPAAARAQTLLSGSIAGVVRDSSGAVLPGVTVEAASPALIEKVRTVVTDDQGRYNIVDLRPGVYAVTFTLVGFSTVRREGLELTTGFTATVNADMKVGALEETITVTGASPIVDTQNVRSQSVLSNEYLETVPTGKASAAYASLILGATTGLGPDVGGSKGENTSSMRIHGSRDSDYMQMIDGMPYTYAPGSGGGGGRAFYVNHLGAEEVVLETSGMSAESETMGVRQNVVPKNGGNTFQLIALANYTGPSLATGNLTDALRARGLTATNSVRRIYDSGVGLGGPIKQDRLWFYTAHRWWGASEYIAGNYFNASPNKLFYTPDLSRQAYVDLPAEDHSVRVTWQAAAKHKVTVSESFQNNCQCFFGIEGYYQPRGVSAPEATNHVDFFPISLTQATWTYPATSRLLFEVGATYGYNSWSNDPVEGVTPKDIGVRELSTGYFYGSTAEGSGLKYGERNDHQGNMRASGSYVTGSHNFKAGLFFHKISPSVTQYVNQDVSYWFRKPAPEAAPVPVSVTQWAMPNRGKTAAQDFAFYAQDQWALRRLTLNLGVRFDTIHAWVPAQTRPGGQFVPEFHFAKVDNVPNLKDVNPRLGAAYDLFGNGKTAIKASLGRYMGPGNLASANSPSQALVQTATRVWTDANRDYVPQETELGPLSNRAFGTVVQNTHYVAELLRGWGKRLYTWHASAALQQEFRAGLGLTISYYRTSYGNFRATDNLNVTPADYSPFCVTAPVDARLPGGGGNQICGLYDITPTAFGSVNNLVTRASHFGKQTEVYNGVELSLRARFGQGGVINGGLFTARTTTNTCFVVDSPQQLYQCEVTNPSTQVKLNGAYPLPWDLQASWTYQNLQGTPILADLVYTNAQIAPSLGRNLGACGTRVSCNATAVVSLIEPGTTFEDRYDQLDLRLTKIIRMGRARLRAMADAYNVFNRTGITARNNSYGPTWRPSNTQLGRLFKFGVQVDY